MTAPVRLKVLGIEGYDYADILALEMEGENVRARLELPLKILEEAGWTPSRGEEVNLELAEELGQLNDWEIVLSGKLLRSGEEEVTYSFGGLLFTLRGAVANRPKKAYLKLRRVR